ncbi:MAG: hypothetical protein K2Q18_08510 [Bdellovibrionales bacterium]|nr:hypothetical protein [Bdellovibrionales bacterium]
MKALFLAMTILTATQTFASNLSDNKIAELYAHNKLDEKSFNEVQLSKAEKEKLVEKFEVIASDLSHIWGDTVLEGPYHQLQDAKLQNNEISGLFYHGELVGFEAYVSAESAFTDECEYKYDLGTEIAEREYIKCLQDFKGTISERFITNINGEHIQDFYEPADFAD